MAKTPGIYMGGQDIEGLRSVDVRDLFAEIETQTEAAEEGYSWRNFFDVGGDIIKTIYPGIGHVIDLIGDTLSQQLIDVGDPSKIAEKETILTEGQAGKTAEAFRDIEKAATPTFVESILSQLVSYAGTEVGGEMLGDFQTGVKEHGLKDTMARMFGVGSKKFGKKVTAQGIADMPWLKNVDPLTGFEGGDSFSDFLIDPGATAGYAGDYMGFPFEKESDYPDMPTFQQGGRVPKYRGGGNVQGGVPTITDYFNRQGKSLGGSNNESLAEILGRK